MGEMEVIDPFRDGSCVTGDLRATQDGPAGPATSSPQYNRVWLVLKPDGLQGRHRTHAYRATASCLQEDEPG